jgi:hypothetical protein
VVEIQKELIPYLESAFCEPADSEPIYFGKHIVPKTFTAIYSFRDKRPNSLWRLRFHISISELETPSLDSLNIENGADRWKIKLVEQYRFQLLELALKLVITTRTPAYMLREEYSIETVAILRALSQSGYKSTNPLLMELPTGIKGEPADFVRYWDGNPNPTSAKELQELVKLIDTRIRKRVTPEYLQHIARIYTEAVADKENPIKAIMDSEGVAHRTASEYATKARQHEKRFLPPTTSGKVTVKKTTSKKGKK